jgi:hypothetical protein
MTERHPAEEDLFLLADGALGRFKGWRLRTHLKRCWTCRRLVDGHRQAINALVEHRDAVELSTARLVPGMRARFSARLSETAHAKPARRRGPIWVWAATAAALVYLFVTFWRVPAISADSVIERAGAAESQTLSGIDVPVLRQELRFRRPKSAVSTLVVWTDLANGEQSAVDRESGWEHYQEILTRNHVGRRQRGLAGTQQAWRKGIIRKSETVTREDGALLVATQAEGPFSPQAITRMELLVRTADWRPVRQTVYVQENGEIADYQVEEVAASVMARKSLPPGVFDAPPPPRPAEASATEAAPHLPATTNAVSEVQSSSEEIRARLLLHHLGACLGEGIEYMRGRDGRVTVRGQVATEARKQELVQALQSLPHIRADLHSAEETVPGDALAAPAPGPTPAPAVETSSWIAPLQALRLDSGRTTELVNSAVPLSSSALDEAWALRRLSERFPVEAVSVLDREDRAAVETMLRDHRERLEGKIARLRQTLAPILAACQGCNVGPVPGTGWNAAAGAQFRAVQEVDRILSSLVTPAAPPAADPDPLLRSLSMAMARADQIANVLRDAIRDTFRE